MNNSNLRTKEITAKWHLHENFDTADCEMLPGIPLPFSNELLTEVFVYPEDVFQLYKEMDEKLRLKCATLLKGAA